MIDLSSIQKDIEQLMLLVDSLRYDPLLEVEDIQTGMVAMIMSLIMGKVDLLATEKIDCPDCLIEAVNGEARFLIAPDMEGDSRLKSSLVLERDCLFCGVHHMIEIEL